MGEYGLPECETEVAGLRAALLLMMEFYAPIWQDSEFGSDHENPKESAACAAALKALGLPDPCRLEDWPER